MWKTVKEQDVVCLDMEFVHHQKANHDGPTATSSAIASQNKNSKRRLSVSIVESEEGRRRSNDNERKGNVGGDAYGDNGSKYASNISELMTQDCIEWDERRHDVDLRKIADPNFQTPLTKLYGATVPTTDEQTIGSISPKEPRSSFGSTTSRSDIQSPVPVRRRQRRRRESLDVIARDVCVLKASGINFVLPQNNKENDATIHNPVAAIVSTERHTKRHGNNEPDIQNQHNDRNLHTNAMKDITNSTIVQPSLTVAGNPQPSVVDGTTDFADLLQKIQTTNVVVGKQKDDCNITETTPPPHISNDATIRPIVPSAKISDVGADDDEFEDVQFSFDELATIDAMVHTVVPKKRVRNDIAANTESDVVLKNNNNVTGSDSRKTAAPATCSTTTVLSKTEELADNDENDPFGDIPDIDIDALLSATDCQPDVLATTKQQALTPCRSKQSDTSVKQTTNEPQTMCLNGSSKSNESLKSVERPKSFTDDQFDDLPDFDVEAFLSKQEFVLPSMSCTADDGDDDEFPDVDFDSIDLDVSNVPKINNQPPPINAPIRNRRRMEVDTNEPTFIACSRYKVLDVVDDKSTYTKTVSLTEWTTDMLINEDKRSRLIHHPSDRLSSRPVSLKTKWTTSGVIYLRGEWYYTRLQTDDTIHIVSLTGRFCTETLPIIFHTCPPPDSDTDDDLLLIVHPDVLLTPTIISETVGCTRRAVLKNRLGATGLSSKPALDGTMRHALFEETMKTKDFTIEAALSQIQSIVRKHAESLLACNVSTRDAEKELSRFLPQLKLFANEYTEFGPSLESKTSNAHLEGHGAAKSSKFVAKSVVAVEEPVISPEMGLKGNVDMLVKAVSTMSTKDPQPSPSIMGIELKTGHHQQAQSIHVAQLALYIIMLQTRFGTNDDHDAATAMKSGVLLYMNNESIRAIHIAPIVSEIKSLIGMRNLVAIETTRSQRPRGVRLLYEGSDLEPNNNAVKVDLQSPGPTELPELLPNSFTCKKCYSNRECMMYAAASHNSLQVVGQVESHRDLLRHFTGHLVDDEYEYFTKWDSLIDFEADASSSLIARAWLQESKDIESEFSTSVSSLTFDETESSPDAVFDESWFAAIGFKRSTLSPIQTPLSELGFELGCRVVIGTDSTSIRPSNTPQSINGRLRPQMHILRGTVHKATETHLYILTSRDDLMRIESFLTKTVISEPTTFRIDKENLPTGITTLRQNLVNLFTADKKAIEIPGSQVEQTRLSWLRDVLIRLRKPRFDASLVKGMFSLLNGSIVEPVPGCDLTDLCFEFSTLNQDQQFAVEQVIAAQDYTLVQGLPGSGKTSTIAFVARLLAAHGKRVLITSYTHAAVDNVLLKLIESGVSSNGNNGQALVRIGKKSSCHIGVHATLASVIALQLETDLNTQQRQVTTASSEYLKSAMSNARIVGVTALSIPRSPLLFREHFDFVIVDEAGQISQPAIIGALLAADSFILVGDHMQLPPLVVSELAGNADYGESMLKRLADKHPDSVSQLTYQYRMHNDICQLSNDIVYKGKLKCANDLVAKRMLILRGFPDDLEKLSTKETFSWLRTAIDPNNAVVFLDTDKINIELSNSIGESFCSLERSNNRRSGGSIVNETEAFIVKSLIEGLISCGVDPSSIGVISPFRAQLRLLDEHPSFYDWKRAGLEVSTIDRFQGRDKSVILLSFVRSNTKANVGHLLRDFRRLNVAVTRAKYKLIMVGSYSTLYKGSDVLKSVLDRVSTDNHLIQLPSNTSTSHSA